MGLSLRETVVGDVRLALFVLLATVGFVLLIACANVGNLMLARSEVRGREIAVRVALGAGRGRLVRQLLTESVLYSLLGGGVAVLLAHFGVKGLIAIDPSSVPRADAISTDLSVLGFTGALALVTGLAFGLIPATRAGGTALHDTLKEGTRGSTTRGRLRVGRVLATVEVALAFVLAIGAGLLIQSFRKLRTIDSGLDARNVLTLSTLVPSATYPDDQQVARFYEQLEQRARALPGVQRAGLVSELPIGGSNYDWTFRIEGRDVPQGQSGPNADYSVVSREYFQAIGIPLLRGRSFTEFDRDSANPVVVINQTMAEQLWPNEDPIGKRISLFGPPVWHTIVGIMGDVHSRGLGQPPRAEMYLDHRQMSALGSSFRSLSLVLQTTSDPMGLVGPIRNLFRELDPKVPFGQVQTVETIVAGSLSQERFSMLLLGVFAALALSLAAIGIYGVMSYSVAHRAQEIGIRMALGADRTKVRKLIVRQGMQTAAIGLAVGLVLAVLLTRGMQSLLYQVTATDPLTYVAVGIVLFGVSWVSNFVPALRASRGDPMLALRSE